MYMHMHICNMYVIHVGHLLAHTHTDIYIYTPSGVIKRGLENPPAIALWFSQQAPAPQDCRGSGSPGCAKGCDLGTRPATVGDILQQRLRHQWQDLINPLTFNTPI